MAKPVAVKNGICSSTSFFHRLPSTHVRSSFRWRTPAKVPSSCSGDHRFTTGTYHDVSLLSRIIGRQSFLPSLSQAGDVCGVSHAPFTSVSWLTSSMRRCRVRPAGSSPLEASTLTFSVPEASSPRLSSFGSIPTPTHFTRLTEQSTYLPFCRAHFALYPSRYSSSSLVTSARLLCASRLSSASASSVSPKRNSTAPTSDTNLHPNAAAPSLQSKAGSLSSFNSISTPPSNPSTETSSPKSSASSSSSTSSSASSSRTSASNSPSGLFALWRQYGLIGLSVYFGIYFVSLSLLTLLASRKAFSATDLQWLAEQLHLQAHLDTSKLTDVSDSWKARLLLAWVAAKIIEPLRALLAIALTPSVARFLWRKGWVKKAGGRRPAKSGLWRNWKKWQLRRPDVTGALAVRLLRGTSVLTRHGKQLRIRVKERSRVVVGSVKENVTFRKSREVVRRVRDRLRLWRHRVRSNSRRTGGIRTNTQKDQ